MPQKIKYEIAMRLAKPLKYLFCIFTTSKLFCNHPPILGIINSRQMFLLAKILLKSMVSSNSMRINLVPALLFLIFSATSGWSLTNTITENISVTASPNHQIQNHIGKKSFYLDMNLGTNVALGPILTWNKDNRWGLSLGMAIPSGVYNIYHSELKYYLSEEPSSLYLGFQLNFWNYVGKFENVVYGNVLQSNSVNVIYASLGWSTESYPDPELGSGISFHFIAELSYLISPAAHGKNMPLGVNLGIGGMF